VAERLRDVVTTPEREADYLARGLWDGTTLAARLAEHAAGRPDAVAVVEQGGERPATFADLDRDSNRVAHFLRRSGVAPGDVVALQLPNWYPSVAIALGAMKAAAVVNPMLPIYRERELRHMLGLARTGVVFTPGGYRGFDHPALIERLRPDLPDLAHHVVVEPGLDRFREAFGAESDRALPALLPAASVSELMFTSGTEAEPKAVMHTERTLNATLRATREALGLTGEDVVWMPAPIGHSTGFNHGLRLAVFLGLPLVLQDRWDPVEGARLVERHRCTHTVLSTTFMEDLTRAAREGAGDVSSLRLFGCGGAPIPPEAVTAAAAVGITCLRVYGATEVLIGAWNRPESPLEKRVHTDGLAVRGVEIEVRDDAGRPVVGEAGELFVRSPSGSVGFFADDARTGATFSPDGWIRTGDLVRLDADGYIAVVGRRKEIIIRGGLNVAPSEIEELIQRIPGVRMVAVVGVPDARLGETTCACVVLEPGARLTFDGLVAHLREAGLATFKLPERLEVMDELPTTATGKVRKHLLVARLGAVQGGPAGSNPTSGWPATR
jgi:acyl-CoA synthetase (AMP-forming)/AMP-acid ligase II